MKIETTFTTKDWIIRLAPTRQANLWNRISKELDCQLEPVYFKPHLKALYMRMYMDNQKPTESQNS